MRPIALQKLYHLQQELWYPRIPSDINAYMTNVINPIYLTKSLALINQYNFNIDLIFDIDIIGGHTPKREYIKDLSTRDLNL